MRAEARPKQKQKRVFVGLGTQTRLVSVLDKVCWLHQRVRKGSPAGCEQTTQQRAVLLSHTDVLLLIAAFFDVRSLGSLMATHRTALALMT